MKFSEVEESTWTELQPYLDTCLIPYTGLNGEEVPWEATAALERLRDFMDLVEIPFKGRIVTYPALQYRAPEAYQMLDEICEKVKKTGFKYVVIITSDIEMTNDDVPNSTLVLSQKELESHSKVSLKSAVSVQISQMWRDQ
ncbi:DUF2487 family protein [Paenibacillus lemnae]|uniref:DUF2487 family protein n=1 Tax=Paenibacillus lemnae TaxID=1330551 RepID=A0A848M9W2_PAELE|nr:DUF2487 family protein [Paenibacillus lemnae]NMO96991.1 DUF2487 family protein [Paenibacillus lemnae]